jgi:hypothetical protein
VPLPAAYRGVPRLAVDNLTPEQAAAIIAADESGAVVCAPGQPTVLFIDLGRYEYSPALSALHTADGRPLLEFGSALPAPVARREDLLVPLGRPAAVRRVAPLDAASAGPDEGGEAQ